MRVLVRSVTQFLDKCSVVQASMSLSLTFTKRSLKLNVLVTDSFTTFGYNGIIRAKGVMPYSLFGDFLLLYIPKVDSMMSEEMQIFISSVSCASSFRKGV